MARNRFRVRSLKKKERAAKERESGDCSRAENGANGSLSATESKEASRAERGMLIKKAVSEI